ncbi:RidA family protein [Exiguobacterium flavidum]|uniref:RidA family protein n=1 Tax=Exiguobacterium flavidum TaxID=2184695 RepID=UPI000DF77B5B|nr:RidA family protein [Exiguobacterium flavidum]
MTHFKKIDTTNAPAAIGPYSQGFITNGMLYASGQIPIDPTTGELVAGSITDETNQVMRNIQAVLDAAGITKEDVVKTTCYLTSMDDFAEFNAAYGSYFDTHHPARSCVAVKELPKGARVEVEVLGVIGDGR